MTLPDSAPPPPPPRAAHAALILITLAAFAVWIYPPLLDHVGLEALARWMTANLLHRVVLMPGLLVLSMLSGASQRRTAHARRRESWQPFAEAIGGRLQEAPDQIADGVWQGGPTIETEMPGGRVTYETVREGDRAWTRARATLASTEGLAFQVLGPQAGRRFLVSMLAPLQALALSQAAARARGDEARRAIAALSFLSHPEVPTGQPDLEVMVSLRTNQPEEARRLLAAPGLCGALHRLAAGARGWQWSLVPDAEGTGLMEFRFAGVETDVDRLRAAHDLLRETLDYLAAAPAHAAG
jgi:hypothetical protein